MSLILSQRQLHQLFELDSEVIDIEEVDGRHVPVVRTYDDEKHHLRFWCIHCRTWHLHGRGGPTYPYTEGRGGMAGDRSAHCTAENSPFKPNGVILHVVGKFTEDLGKRYKKGRTLYCSYCRKEYSAALNACNCDGQFVNKKRTSIHAPMAATYQSFFAR